MEDGRSKQKLERRYLLSECGLSTAIQCLRNVVLGWGRKGREWIGVKGGVEECGFLEEYRYLFPLVFDGKKVGCACSYCQ